MVSSVVSSSAVAVYYSVAGVGVSSVSSSPVYPVVVSYPAYYADDVVSFFVPVSVTVYVNYFVWVVGRLAAESVS